MKKLLGVGLFFKINESKNINHFVKWKPPCFRTRIFPNVDKWPVYNLNGRDDDDLYVLSVQNFYFLEPQLNFDDPTTLLDVFGGNGVDLFTFINANTSEVFIS